jgi:hypothetical protein
MVRMTTLADTNRTSMTNVYCVYTVSRYSWWWTVDMSETCRVLYQINMRNSASRCLSLEEYITMQGPLNVKISIKLYGTEWVINRARCRNVTQSEALCQQLLATTQKNHEKSSSTATSRRNTAHLSVVHCNCQTEYIIHCKSWWYMIYKIPPCNTQ